MKRTTLALLALVLGLLVLGATGTAATADEPMVALGDGELVPQSAYDALVAEAQRVSDSLDAREQMAGRDATNDGLRDPHNCHSKVQKRGDSWGQKSGAIRTLTLVGQKTSWLYVTSMTIYRYCPNGDRQNKLYPQAISHCYTWITEPGQNPPYWWFTGAFMNAHIYESGGGGRNVNPPRFGIEDDGTRQNCKSQIISSGHSAWLRTDEAPRVKQWNIAQLRNMGDEEWAMLGYKGRPYNKILPAQSIVLSKWKQP